MILVLLKKLVVMEIFWQLPMVPPNLKGIEFLIQLAFSYVFKPGVVFFIWNSYKGFVMMEINELCKIAGIDNVKIKMFDGRLGRLAEI